MQTGSGSATGAGKLRPYFMCTRATPRMQQAQASHAPALADGTVHLTPRMPRDR